MPGHVEPRSVLRVSTNRPQETTSAQRPKVLIAGGGVAALEAMLALRALAGERVFPHGIRRLHAAGGSLREIAERFRLSHQRVHQIVDAAADAGQRGRGGALLERIKGRVRDWSGFARFTQDARAVVVRSQEEARALEHGQVGTEHLLLGLLRGTDAELAVRALHGLGIGFEAVRAEIVRHLGAGDAVPEGGSVLFTPRAKKVLELALREALALRHDYIGTEHILLGLVRESSGLAARVLRDLGAEPGQVRAEVRRLL